MKVVPPIVKTKFCNLLQLALEIFRRPVALSRVAPVALWYFEKASAGMIRCCTIMALVDLPLAR